MLSRCTSQPNAMAARTARRTAPSLGTGNAPGSPRHTGQTLVLGASPKVVEQAQNILDRVLSWTWTSRPMTVSQVIAPPPPGPPGAPARTQPGACAPRRTGVQ